MNTELKTFTVSELFGIHIIRGYHNVTLNKLSSMLSVINHRGYLDLFYRELDSTTDEYLHRKGQRLGELIFVGAYHDYNWHDDPLTRPMTEMGVFRMLFPNQGKWTDYYVTFTKAETQAIHDVLQVLIQDHSTIEIKPLPLHELVSDTEL
ncbi:hypothetical protein [Pseudoalteromonas phage KB12-38]|nr:hypothetical protein [Pseudoalteromonas phage KB12-38]